jgi:hypothetical protein
MKINLLAVCWNEEDIIPYFLRHYTQFCNKIVVFDNESTDNSVKLLKECSLVEVRSFATEGCYVEETLTEIRNTGWKDDRECDWQIVVDMDEFVYHPNLLNILNNAKQYNVITTEGYQMYGNNFIDANTFAGQIYDQIKTGVRFDWYGKSVIFNPQEVKDINFRRGSHKAAPGPNAKDDIRSLGIKLLHYKFLGYDYLIKRGQQLDTRLGHLTEGTFMKIGNFGGNEPYSLHSKKRYKELYSKTKIVI